jgi:hypothetical protein
VSKQPERKPRRTRYYERELCRAHGVEWNDYLSWRTKVDSHRCVFRGVKESLAAYCLMRHPGDIRRASDVRVQSSRYTPMDWIDIGALLRAASIEPGSRDERELLAWAVGEGDLPTAPYHRFSRAVDRARRLGRVDLIGRRRTELPKTKKTEHPEGKQGLREEPLDPRSPVNGEYESEFVA